MPQPGLHAILALATRKTFSTRPWFALGLAFGALIPDVDSYAQAFAILIRRMDPVQAEALYHRTLTHSLFFGVALGLLFYLISQLSREERWRAFGLGCAVGVAVLHTFIDIFAWFDGVGVLWPVWSINLWGWVMLPDVVITLLRAANFYAFAGYFAYLAILARRTSTDDRYLPRLRLYAIIQLGLGAAFTVAALTLSAGSYNVVDGAVFLFWAYPNALWVTWRMRQTIETT